MSYGKTFCKLVREGHQQGMGLVGIIAWISLVSPFDSAQGDKCESSFFEGCQAERSRSQWIAYEREVFIYSNKVDLA